MSGARSTKVVAVGLTPTAGSTTSSSSPPTRSVRKPWPMSPTSSSTTPPTGWSSPRTANAIGCASSFKNPSRP